MSVIALDIGTSRMKAGLFSQEGRPNAILSKPYAAASATLASGEFDPERWVEAAEELLRDLSGVAFESLKGDPIAALCVSGNGPTLVAAGKDGRAALPALLWIDRRAQEEAREISSRLGMEIDPAFYLPKALWILRHRPELSDSIAAFMPCPEYLSFRLSGVAHAVLPSPHFERYIWSPELLSSLGLPREKFPPLVPAGAEVGKVDKEVALRTGLPSDCRVVAGLPDFMAAQLGAGAVDPGIALDRTGSSEALNLCALKPFPDRRLFSTPHAVSGLWNVSGGVSTSGSALAWLRGLFGAAGELVGLPAEQKEMEAAGPGSGGLLFLPYLHGERAPLWNPEARGALVGLDIGHGRGHVERALLESIAYALREVVEMQEGAGLPCGAVHVSGGAVANTFWLGLKADILKRPVIVPSIPETELAGAAALALAASGAYPGPSAAAKALFSPRTAIDPDPARFAAYDECYGRFLEARERVLSLAAPSLLGGKPA